MSTAHDELSDAGQWLRRLTVAVLMFLCAGCNATPARVQKLVPPVGQGSKDQTLRKQVDGDSFPTARQAGL